MAREPLLEEYREEGVNDKGWPGPETVKGAPAEETVPRAGNGNGGR